MYVGTTMHASLGVVLCTPLAYIVIVRIAHVTARGIVASHCDRFVQEYDPVQYI